MAGRSLVSCRNEVSTTCELIEEAEELWAAEQSEKPKALDSISKNYERFKHGNNETPAVNQEGMSSIPWPKTESGDPLNVDLLLATANQPSITKGCYATPCEIAAA